MKSRWIINLLLLLAVVILGLVARFEPGIEQPDEPGAITPLKAEDIHRIHLNRPVRDDLVLVRRAHEQWVVERVTDLPADPLPVRTLTRLAEQLPVRSYAASDMDLQALQLDPPYATAFLNDIAVEFGNLEPIDDLRYVRVGNTVHLIPDRHIQLMETGYAQFVRRRLFAAGARIESIRLPALGVTKTASGWETTPASDASADTVQQFITRWQEAAGVYVQSADTHAGGETIEIRLAGGDAPIQLRIVSRDPDLVLARPAFGIQYRLGGRGDALLSLEPDAVADTDN